MHISKIGLFLVITIVRSLPLYEVHEGIFSLNIVHINDFHARFEEVSDVAAICKDRKCIGGFSRMYTSIKNMLSKQHDLILLNAGDNFQGTLWYTLYKWNVTQYFFNKLQFDAIVLGNHEFDDGIAGVVPFMKLLNSPFVVANIDDSLEPEIQNAYNKSVVIERKGKKIGIIGIIAKDTNQTSKTGNIKFFDESQSANAEAERLVRDRGVFTNIVLSHSGYDVEKAIANKVTAASKISLVVGGHSHTFLYTGSPRPGSEKPQGPYPTIVNRIDGKQVLVVQASSYNRYIGNITAFFDREGNCVDWSGAPIFLDTDLSQDEEINKELQSWKEKVDKIGSKVIGRTLVFLDEKSCSYRECLLGNLVTDSMVYSYLGLSDKNVWSYAALAITNCLGLRAPIQSGNITYGDLSNVTPFANTIDVGEIKGMFLKQLFERAVASYKYESINVNFLQVSGFRIVFNMSQPVGSRVKSFKVRCNECCVPIYEDIILEKTYRLIVNSFLKNGGDGFEVLSNNLENIKVGSLDIEVCAEYLTVKSPVIPELEGRLEFV